MTRMLVVCCVLAYLCGQLDARHAPWWISGAIAFFGSGWAAYRLTGAR